MRKLALAAVVLLAAPGCILVDYAVDPVGVGTGFHEPIFPWYPLYLISPPPPPPKPVSGSRPVYEAVPASGGVSGRLTSEASSP